MRIGLDSFQSGFHSYWVLLIKNKYKYLIIIFLTSSLILELLKLLCESREIADNTRLILKTQAHLPFQSNYLWTILPDHSMVLRIHSIKKKKFLENFNITYYLLLMKYIIYISTSFLYNLFRVTWEHFLNLKTFV